jgi:YidC/Oxa1 family membrane protein insertase
MDKRLILAIALSLLVLLLWSALVARLQPIGNKEVTEKILKSSLVSSNQITPSLTPAEPPSSSLITLSKKDWEIIFIEPQAAIKEVVFKAYQSYKFSLQYGLLIEDKNLVFKKENISQQSATFVYQDMGKRITKRYLFSDSDYNLDLEIEVENLSQQAISINLPLVLGVLNFGREQTQARFQDVTVALSEKIIRPNARKDSLLEKVKFLGLRDRYFCAIIEPDAKDESGFIKRINPQQTEIGLVGKEILLNPGQTAKEKFHIYLGPQELRFIRQLNPDWTAVMYYGAFDFIAQILLRALEAVYRIVHNWGWAVVVLSLVIYLILYPLTIKQMRSMKQMQALQPITEELKKTYKDNPQKLNKETMELYRKHKVNPLGGCLPMVLQIPIFFALYQVLIRYIVLKGASFLWIKDLSEPDRLYILAVSLPIVGNEINILPILISIGMFLQQKLSMRSMGTGSSEQQRLMTMLMPVMFGFIFYHMPAGVVLYWFVNNLLMLINQLQISRVK